jgi:hypothetical protein
MGSTLKTIVFTSKTARHKMKISLIENGLDSLRKGYVNLERYERLLSENAIDSERFSALKDSVLSIQHGVEILFKYSLTEKNEILLFTDITKLKEAFKRRREGEIEELYEHEGLHTVTFKESIERLRDICGIPMSDKFTKNLKKVEGWRNSITHSAVLLLETEVSSILMKFLSQLDDFFGPLIGAPYLEGQGRTELDRAYRLTKAVYGELANKIKALTVERLIHALQRNKIKNVSASSTFLIRDPSTAFSVLQQIQGDEIKYGCDFVNLNNSGHATICKLSNENILTIEALDTDVEYQFSLDGIVVYIPEINNDMSPLIFMYSKEISPLGEKPALSTYDGYKMQHGVKFDIDDSYVWEEEYLQQSIEDYSSGESNLHPHKTVTRFLTGGLVCFMNVQLLKYGDAHRLIGDPSYQTAEKLHAAFQEDN